MKVLYRIAPNLPTKSPIFKDDKFSLMRICLKSFVDGFKDIKPEIVFILDSCPKKYKKCVKKVPFPKTIIEMESAGNIGTYQKQLELASKTNDYVLFQEDDYLYLPCVGRKVLSALEKFDFITPQDEYLYYFDEPRHIGRYEIKVVGNHHWREVNSTTLTFGTHGKLIKENQDLFTKYGTGDYPMWQDLRGRGYKLFSSIPSLATHMVEGILAPTIPWSNIWQKYQS